MRRIQLRQNLYFLLDIFYLILRTLQINDLNCHSLLRPLVISAEMVGLVVEIGVVEEQYPL